MLVRRDGGTLNASLKRLYRAISKFFDNDEIIDKISAPDSRLTMMPSMPSQHIAIKMCLTRPYSAPFKTRNCPANLGGRGIVR